jgi:subtilase family serine protease
MQANKPVTIELTVKNTGKVDNENVTVRFYDGNVPSGVVTLERLPGDTNKTVVFTWIPTEAGTYKLKFVIDPDDQIMETDEEDNIKQDKVTVRSGGGLMPGFEGVFLMVAIMVGAAAVLLRRKD